jgi:phosphatidylserine decarboxylase
MKHSGRATKAALKLMAIALAILVVSLAALTAVVLGAKIHLPFAAIGISFTFVWMAFCMFTIYFFRDPDPRVPDGRGVVVSPAHGKIDIIDQVTEPLFMSGPCQRISIFLSVIDIHVQNAPISGALAFYKYTTGQFLNALKSESAAHNENALLGIESSERPGVKIGVRLIAGLIARRIVPFARQGEMMQRGERISMIQFGSRTDLYLPLTAKIKIKLGDRAVGGETIMAVLD